MTLRVDIDIPGSSFSGVLEISGTDARLTDAQAARIQRAKSESITAARGRLPVPPQAVGLIEIPGVQIYGNSFKAIHAFVAEVAQTDGRIDESVYRFLTDLVRSDEALVPHFNSPPSEWAPLRSVVEQASAVGLGVTIGEGSLPVLIGAYIGGLFMVKFVTPIVAEMGNATADGVGAKIRNAFGIESPVSQVQENTDEPTSPRSGSSVEDGEETTG